MLYSTPYHIQRIYHEYYNHRPCILIGAKRVVNTDRHLVNPSVKEIQEYYQQTSISSHLQSICLFYHTFSLWEKEQQVECIKWLTYNAIEYIIIDYTLAERTLEWCCGFIKYILTFPYTKKIYCFVHNGGLSGLLHAQRVNYSHSIRFPLTQELLIIQKHK